MLILSQIAIQTLTIPASSASVERINKVAKNILTDERNRLSPLIIEILTFLKKNYDLI